MDSGWDFTALDQELAEITEIDMSEFGFGASMGEQEVNIDELFAANGEGKKKNKTVTCPHCGQTFEP